MGLNDVVIIPSQNGLGRGLPGQDYISGMMFYCDTVPSGFASNNIQQVLSVAQAEALGILDDYSDESKAWGIVTISGAGAAGDVVSIYVQEPVNNVLLGSYTVKVGDTAQLIAAGLVQACAVRRNTTGYDVSWPSSSIHIAIYARPGLGLFLNSGSPLSTTIVGTVSTTITQFTAGKPSYLAQWHYHIAEYFRIQPSGSLFVGFFPVSGQTWDFAEVTDMQVAANGAIRQVGLYLGSPSGDGTDPSISELIASDFGMTTVEVIPAIADLLQAKATSLASLHTPLITIFATDLAGLTSPDTFTALTTLKDLTTHADNRVSVTISQDGAGLGAAIFAAQGTSITDIGAILGAVSLSAVSQSIAWVGGFNLTNGVELATPAYANGRLVNEVADQTLQLQLQNFAYIFLRTYQGVSGTFAQNNSCAIKPSSDYAYINDNRTWDKASRLLYSALIPVLSQSITLNADGTLSATDIAYITSLATTSLDTMSRAKPQELSAFKVIIDPAQNLLQTGTLIVTVQLLPEAIARNIVVNLGFVSSIS